MTSLKKCGHYKNNASCALQSEECDVLGCANSGYQPTLCKGKMLYPSRKTIFNKQNCLFYLKFLLKSC